jgi:hypothetical protein
MEVIDKLFSYVDKISSSSIVILWIKSFVFNGVWKNEIYETWPEEPLYR